MHIWLKDHKLVELMANFWVPVLTWKVTYEAGLWCDLPSIDTDDCFINYWQGENALNIAGEMMLDVIVFPVGQDKDCVTWSLHCWANRRSLNGTHWEIGDLHYHPLQAYIMGTSLYPITNWPKYNNPLINRGSLTFPVDAESCTAGSTKIITQPASYWPDHIYLPWCPRVFSLTLRRKSGRVYGDCAYDGKVSHQLISHKGVTVCIPPRKSAGWWKRNDAVRVCTRRGCLSESPECSDHPK